MAPTSSPALAGVETTIDGVARCGALAAVVGLLTAAIAKLALELTLCHTVPLLCIAEETEAVEDTLAAFNAELDRILARYRALGCITSDS